MPIRSCCAGTPLTYDAAGVDSAREQAGLSQLARWISATFQFNPAKPLLPLGYFANVIRLTPEMGLAISTDGVGTKLLIAQALQRFDTVGIDCVAMNVNDILCVGAKPVSMVDYIAVGRVEPAFLGDIAKGLHDGAQMAEVNIAGGEIAQVPEMLRHGGEQPDSFDLVGTCVGTVHPERLLVGQQIEPGDLVVGLASSGIHSNGLSLARRALGLSHTSRLSGYIAELGRTIGDELLRPTNIYVREILRMLEAGLALKALIHITGDGLLNLARVSAEAGYVIDQPLAPQPIFSIIKHGGDIADAEMFRVFNMGVGFCVVVTPHDAPAVQRIAEQHGRRAAVIGYTVRDSERRVWIPTHRLVGSGGAFRVTDDKPPLYPAAKA